DESWPPSSLYDRFQPSDGYHVVPPPYTGTFMPPKLDLVFNTAPTAVETDHSAFIVQLSLTKPDQDLFQPSDGYHVVPPPYTGTFMPPKLDLVFNTAPTAVETDHSAFIVQLSPTKPDQDLSLNNRPLAPIIEDWVSDSEDESETKASQIKMAKPTARNHAHRGYHKQYAPMTSQNPHKHIVPAAVLTQSKPVSITVVRPVSVVVPKSNVTQPRHATPIVTKTNSPIIRHLTRSPSLKVRNSPPNVTAVKDAVVSVAQGNMSYLSYFKELNDGYVAFGGNPKGGNLVRGLPTKVFENDNTCVACKKGKQHRASCKTKPVSSVDQPLYRLHMDLFGPTFVLSLNKKIYCLVVKDDYSRFTWVFFLATKDETSPILKTFITGLENQFSLKVKVIRSDNGTEFKNNDLNQFCGIKGIKMEFSVPRTPQQNGIAERKNRTLIKAARTMLADSLLPIPFWAEAVNTACYVQNKVLVTNPHNKTPYELLHGRTPSIGFMRPFGCPVTILNTLDSLDKFERKVDEGFLVGYSVSSKAFRVFNNRTCIVQETLHVNFLENKPNVAGSGPTWLFDIDSLTRTMNYQPVTAGNQSNASAGFQDKFDAEKAGEEIDQQYVLLPVWSSGSTNPQNSDEDAAFDGKEPDFDAKKPESEVNVSPSSSAQSRKQDDKTKRETKGKSPIESFTGYRDLNADTNTFSTAGPSHAAASPTHGKSSFIDASQLPDDPNMPELEDITYSDDEDDVGAEADFNNLEISITVSHIPTTRVHKDHPVTKIIGDLSLATQTKSMTRVAKDQGELSQIFNDDFHTLARIEAIRLFLAYASFMGFMVYQMDVKSAFLYGTIKEEVYVCQPPRFEDPDHPDKVYKLVKALYGIHQAPRAWYETLANYLLENGFQRGKIDKNLFIQRQKYDILLVQIYVDDIIFGATNKDLCKYFKKLMKDKFQMSSMGELTFFLGLQVKKKKDRKFISQDKYVAEILRKFGLTEGKSASTHIDTEKPLLKDPDGEDVDVHTYRSMIGSLMYLTSSRPDIMFTVCACARFQVTPKASHLHTVKRIFIYLKGKPHLGLWYLKDSPFDLVAYSDSDYAGASLDRKYTTRGCQFLGCKLISWQCKKQTVVTTSSTRAEYVVCLSGMESLKRVLHVTYNLSPGINTPRCDEDRLELMELTVFLLPKVEKVEIGVNVVDLQVSAVRHKLLLFSLTNWCCSLSAVSYIKHALTINPHTYVSCIKQFWNTVVVKQSNDVTRLQALVEKKKVVITEATIRDALCLDDAEGVDCLPNEEIFAELAHMAQPWLLLLFACLQVTGDDQVKRRQDEIYKIDMDHVSKVLSMQEDEPKVQEVVDVVTTAKLITKVVTAASESVTAANEEYARKLHEELNKDIDWNATIDHVKQKAKEDSYVQSYQVMKKRPQTKAQARRNMITYLKNVVGFRLENFKGMSYDDIRSIFEAKFNSNIEFLLKSKVQLEEEENRAIQSINETPAQKAAKRRKLNEEVEDLKQHLEIVPDEDDDVYTEATPLARKVPVVDYEIIHFNNKPHYKIIRADGTHQLYVSFITMLKNFEREDLESLWSLVKERFSTSKPNNFSDDYFLTTLGAMCERPDGQAKV
nr:putative ribonuclease H-like domain-containing protein [Tanacetum cinerariifolium]